MLSCCLGQLNPTPIVHHIAALFTVILLLVPSPIASMVCPPDATTAVFACFGTLTDNMSSSYLVAGGDVQQISAKCQDGSFKRTASCVSDLFWACRKRESQMKKLEHVINPDNVRLVFSQLCHKFQMYSDNSACLKRHSQGIQKCVKNRQQLFQRLQHESYDYRSRQDKSNIICNFMTGVTRCIERRVWEFCSCPLSDFIKDFMSGLYPPSCPHYVEERKCRLVSNSEHNLTPRTWFISLTSVIVASLFTLNYTHFKT